MEKLEIARHQLGTSLALFLDDLDPISVHFLVCSAARLLGFIAEEKNLKSFWSWSQDAFPELSVHDERNRYYNAMKHFNSRNGAFRDDAILLNQFDDPENDQVLLGAWYDYKIISGKSPIEADLFIAWFGAVYRDQLDPDSEELKITDACFPNFPLERSKQKASLRDRITFTKDNSLLEIEPMIEKRPLIIPRQDKNLP